MENSKTECVTTTATIENLQDVWDVERGLLAADEVRCVTVTGALVDTSVTMLSLPARLISRLGLKRMMKSHTASLAGVEQSRFYEAARLTVRDRFCSLDVRESPDSVPVRIGRIPLHQLDLVVDPNSQSLTGNPAHGFEYVLEAY